MNKAIYDFFTRDHERIDGLLNQATAREGVVDETLYHAFRTGLLTHIKMEEKILFPAAQRANGGEPVPLAARLRLEHGAITALMVLPPDERVIRVIRHVLEKHDLAEEEPGGMYDICEALTQGQTAELLQTLAETTEVPVHPPNPSDFAVEAARRALARAGFDYDQLARGDAQAD